MPSTSLRLSAAQIKRLKTQGCTASDWKAVAISKKTDLARLHNVTFSGSVRLGDTGGTVTVEGVERPCGIYDAAIDACSIGDHVRIAGIGSVLSNYEIADGVVVENVASLVAETGSSFGNGTQLETVNEGGGREVTIVNELTAQTAYVQAMMRHNPEVLAGLDKVLKAKVREAVRQNGFIASKATVLHCGALKNIVVGPHATLHGVLAMENGTVNSCAEHPTVVGDGVIARAFIIAEGARVDGGAMLDKVFVGQGVKMGKQYSAENSLFFANCEAFHGEAVALFAGPYTVSHHKSTLLIAGLFSFYNAGSGSNQSNHMYKLGPVHQGILERGSKTGSFSYLLWEAHVGAFSVIIGKHYENIDAPLLPFSYFFEGNDGTTVIPGLNLSTVGTVRDGEKWPQRDNRKAPVKRDLIVFDVFSPYTVEKMRKGIEELRRLDSASDREASVVKYHGLGIRRSHLQLGIQYYQWAVSRYLNGLVARRLAEALEDASDWHAAVARLATSPDLTRAADWTDLAGLLTPVERVEALEEELVGGRTAAYDDVVTAFQAMRDSYERDQWQYVFETFSRESLVRPDQLTKERATQVVEDWIKAEDALQELISADSRKEFGAFARIGYGLDRSEQGVMKDFESVRGTEETNRVVQKLETRRAELRKEKARLLKLIASK